MPETPFGTAPSGQTDLAPTWTSSAKDLVTTSLGAGRLWATLGRGILNEVYWPSTGEPQIRDLGFIVAGPFGWTELKRANRYTIETPAPDVPLPTVVHQGDGYRLRLEIVPDPARDALLIRYRLDGEGCRLYALLAPHLGTRIDANVATVGPALYAQGDGAHLCLMAGGGFSQASAGHVGTSDGWQDFNRNGAMTWTYRSAGPGNVALMGELAQASGLLALGFANSAEGAVTLAQSSLATGFGAVRRAALKGWRDWAADVVIDAPDLPPDCIAEARRSAAVLRAHEDRTFPGAIVASLSVPWGSSHGDLGGYHLVWARDAVNSGLALLATGQGDDARRMLAYLVAMQHPGGHWAQNFYPDGRPFWKGVQLDEAGYPVLLAAALVERGVLTPRDESWRTVRRMVRAAVGFIARTGPLTEQDRWEENGGLSPQSVAVAIAALVAGADWLDGAERDRALDSGRRLERPDRGLVLCPRQRSGAAVRGAGPLCPHRARSAPAFGRAGGRGPQPRRPVAAGGRSGEPGVPCPRAVRSSLRRRSGDRLERGRRGRNPGRGPADRPGVAPLQRGRVWRAR